MRTMDGQRTGSERLFGVGTKQRNKIDSHIFSSVFLANFGMNFRVATAPRKFSRKSYLSPYSMDDRLERDMYDL